MTSPQDPHTSPDEFTVRGARAAADAGALDEWIVEFLSSPGSDNGALAHTLTATPRAWSGPVELRFDELHRLAGPPDQPTLDRFDHGDLDRVDEMSDSVEDGWEPPPLIVSFRDPQLVVEDGNHRIEGLRREGHDRWWALVAFDDQQEREAFERRHLSSD